MSTPLPGVPWTSGGVDDMTAEIDARNDASDDVFGGAGSDDVESFANLAAFPASGTAEVIYIAEDTERQYRWNGSAYVEIGVVLGETSTTAYRGDRGKTAYDHSQATSDAHPASAISIADAGGDFDATEVEGALAELQAQHEALPVVVADEDTPVTVDTGSVAGQAIIGMTATDYQVFTSSGTWTKPALATYVEVWCIGGGGGGGSGRKGATSSARYAGGGGQGGGVAYGVFAAADLAATEAVTVAAAAAGGAAVTANGTDGNDGSNGGLSSFGSWLLANGGAKGTGGTAVGVSVATEGNIGNISKRSSFKMSEGGTQSLTGTAVAPKGGHCGGGGAGGSIDASDNSRAGGAGSGGTGGAGGASGAVVTVGGSAGAGSGMAGGGGGGGGGAASGTTAAGGGAAGGAPGGGGGGGGSGISSAADSGAGGAGAVGRVIVITHF